MSEKKEVFTYTYSADQQKEIKRIREKYAPSTAQEDKMERLRKLDESATKPGMIVSLAVGIISALLLGLGMSCTMVWADTLFIPGIFIGIVGILGVAAAYPLHVHITKKQRKKLAPEILSLSDELMNQ